MQRMRHLLLNSNLSTTVRAGGLHEHDAYLWGLSHINLFVGANNTGKSRFLRSLLSETSLEFFPTVQAQRLTEESWMSEALVNLLDQIDDTDEIDGQDIIWHIIRSQVVGDAQAYNPLEKIYADNLMELLRGIQKPRVFGNPSPNQEKIARWLKQSRSNRLLELKFPDLPGQIQPEGRWKRLYIPVLRGLRPLPGHDDPYAEATKRDFPEIVNSKCQIFTGQSLYEDVRKHLCGNHSERLKIQRFERYLSDTFFRGASVALIPHHERKNTLDIKIGDEPQLPIHNLGDGIQAIIATTFPLFTSANEPTLVGIEEPELNLHPGMQRTLISAFRSFSNCQFFLTTHSNHFLDLTLESDDLSVYAFDKHLPPGDHDERHSLVHITPVSHGDSKTLQLLGTRNSSVFLTNCTVWVEGITDRRYFSHYFRLYQKHLRDDATKQGTPIPQWFQEDLHFAFVEYAGANITHWSWLDDTPDPIEVTRLCGRVMVIADSDDALPKSAKALRQQKLGNKLEKRFVLLESREVENLISARVMAKYFASLGMTNPEERVGTWEGYRQKKLGLWIDKIIAISGVKARKHSAKSGTIEGKTAFAEQIVGMTDSIEDLSRETLLICKRMHAFIQANQDRTADA